jgi:hypothetical protein
MQSGWGFEDWIGKGFIRGVGVFLKKVTLIILDKVPVKQEVSPKDTKRLGRGEGLPKNTRTTRPSLHG